MDPVIAIGLGFTISSELLRALSNRLNSGKNLVALPGEIAAIERWDAGYGGPDEIEQAMDKWGGGINKWFRTELAIAPEDIPSAIAEARGDAADATKERARQ